MFIRVICTIGVLSTHFHVKLLNEIDAMRRLALAEGGQVIAHDLAVRMVGAESFFKNGQCPLVVRPRPLIVAHGLQ